MNKKLFLILLLPVCFGSLLALKQSTIGYYDVVEVFDGDTISVNMRGKIEKVRMIGVDTPETKDPRKPIQCFGETASIFTHATLTGKKVRLQADSFSTNRDRYDRLLRYIYLPDGTLYNKRLLEQGYARAYLGFPFTKSQEFEQVANGARARGSGLWNSCDNDSTEVGASDEII